MKKKRDRRKYRLYIKPARPYKFWPRDAHGHFKFVGVLKDASGWIDGDGDPMTARQIEDCKVVLVLDFKRPAFKVEEVR